MDMDKNQRESSRRIIEYLQLKYDTDVQKGLSFAKVRHRQHMHHNHTTVKKKKWIWLICFNQECQNPLFFFLMYLCVISWFFQFAQRVRIFLLISFVICFFIKIKKAFRHRNAFLKQKEMYVPRTVVLRDNTFKSVPVNCLVSGDIIRLKREERVPQNIISLQSPYTEYKKGDFFSENTGRAIVTNIEEDIIYSKEDYFPKNTALQELFIRQGIYFHPDFLKKDGETSEEVITAVGFEEMYFPSKFQIERFQLFMSELKKIGVEWFFFTSQNKEKAYAIGKQAGIVEASREVIDKKQFLLLKNVALEKQIGSIRIYCGLSDQAKSQVIAMWERYLQQRQNAIVQKSEKVLFMSNFNRTDKGKTLVPAEKKRRKREKDVSENCVYACCSGENQVNDIYFKNNWKDTMIKYIIGENIKKKFWAMMERGERQILGGLCIIMIFSMLLSLYAPKQGNMYCIMQAGSIFCAVYILIKEAVQEGFRHWFLKKINSNINKINNT